MDFVMEFISAAMPSFLLLSYIYWKDSDRPEPLNVLARGVFFGCLSGLLSLCISNSFLGYFRPHCFDDIPFLGGVFAAFYDAALPEETAKLCMLWFLLHQNKEFDESLDAIVYSVCIGMGFAGVENVAYVLTSDEWATTALIRGFLAVPGHYIDAVLMGFFYALVYFAPKRFHKLWPLIWIAPFLAHGAYDTICFAINEFPAASVILFVVLFLFSIQMHNYSIKCINHIIKVGDDLIEDLHEEEFGTINN